MKLPLTLILLLTSLWIPYQHAFADKSVPSRYHGGGGDGGEPEPKKRKWIVTKTAVVLLSVCGALVYRHAQIRQALAADVQIAEDRFFSKQASMAGDFHYGSGAIWNGDLATFRQQKFPPHIRAQWEQLSEEERRKRWPEVLAALLPKNQLDENHFHLKPSKAFQIPDAFSGSLANPPLFGRQRAVAVAAVLNAAGIHSRVCILTIPAYDAGEFYRWAVEVVEDGRIIQVESGKIQTLAMLREKNSEIYLKSADYWLIGPHFRSSVHP